MSTTTAAGNPARDQIFVSYRRADSADITGRLCDGLITEFGHDRVFVDRLNIEIGQDFPDVLQAGLDHAAVLIVMIGHDWLSAADELGRRIHRDDDWVHKEVRYGLSHPDLLVVPALINGAPMPGSDDLPRPLRALAQKQAARLRRDDWAADTDAMSTAIVQFTDWVRRTSSTRVFGKPPIVVNNFEDRPEQLRQIEQSPTSVLTAVSGIGGVGKSQLAAHYFNQEQRRFDCACWIDMRNRDGFDDYEAIATELGLHQPEIDPIHHVRNHIKASGQRWLLVYDNAESPGQLEPLWVQGPNVKTVVTSRYRRWGTFGHAVDIDVFAPDVGARYLLASAQRDEDPHTNDLAQDLGYLPLALNLAGAFCRNRMIGFDAYRDRLANDPIAVLKPQSQEAYDKTIEAIWRESLDSAEQAICGSRETAGVLAAIDWTDIGRSWLAERVDDADRLEDQLVVLASYSLIELRPDRLAVSHNMVANGILADAEPQPIATRLVSLFDGSLPAPLGTSETAAVAAEPIRHLQHVLSNHPHLVTSGLLPTLNTATVQLLHQHQNTVVQALAEANYELTQSLLGAEHPDTLTAKANLAYSYFQAGRTNDAITLEEEVLTDSVSILGNEDPDTLKSKARLAASYRRAGRTNDAIEAGEQVLTDTIRILGPNHPATLNAKANLAAAYRYAGRTNDAIEVSKEVLTDSIRILGPGHPDTLIPKANLAASYRQAGRTNDSIKIFAEVLTDSLRILGPDHPGTLRAKANLATSYREAGRTNDAIAMMSEVLALGEDVFGPDHPTLLAMRRDFDEWTSNDSA